jgi:UDP-N-acetyl-D-mannosaminuronic acid dehydrogenase
MNFDICVLGLGYIGLPTASIFATKGKKVLGVDVLPAVVETINAGKIHIEEPDLDLLVRAAVSSGNLRAAGRPALAATYIIAVPTPFHHGAAQAKTPDLSFVEQATRSLAPVVPAGALIILESTSPVGTTEKVRAWLLDELGRFRGNEAAALGASLRFAHCPERILPGQMLKELVANDRIAGGLTPEAAEAAQELYRIFCTGEIFLTDARTAEMAKLTENSFRDVNIAFANELSLICEKLGIDVWELIRLANRHPRVKILQPGPGVGGHCIAVDPWFIVDAAPDEARLIRTAREVNDRKPARVLEWIKRAAAQYPEPVVACLGLAFKADVDDLRESPAVGIVEQLAKDFAGEILAVEPHIKALPAVLAASGKVKLTDAATALLRANVVVLLVNHRAFREIERQQLAGKTVIDTRGFWQ